MGKSDSVRTVYAGGYKLPHPRKCQLDSQGAFSRYGKHGRTRAPFARGSADAPGQTDNAVSVSSASPAIPLQERPVRAWEMQTSFLLDWNSASAY